MGEHEKINTEQQILEAAEQEFFAKGIDGARTTSIAERAGVTHAMLHYYFRTKEKLFERVVEKNISFVVKTVTAAMGDPQMPIVERLKSAVASHFDLVAAHPELPRFFLCEVLPRPEYCSILRDMLMHTEAAQLFSSLQKDVDEAAGRGEIERVDVPMLLISIISLNIFPFVSSPFMSTMAGELFWGKIGGYENYLSRRKEENIETLVRRIRK